LTVLKKLQLLQEESETRNNEPKSHQRKARSNPGEKRALRGQVIAEISSFAGFL
jgi:hypothetical protein